MDLFPTIRDLLGLPSTGPVDGRSLAEALTMGCQPDPEPVLIEHPTLGFKKMQVSHSEWLEHQVGTAMVRDGSWKYAHHRFDVDELYDLDADPGESTNLAEDPAQESRIAELRGIIAERLQRTGPGLYDWFLDEPGPSA